MHLFISIAEAITKAEVVWHISEDAIELIVLLLQITGYLITCVVMTFISIIVIYHMNKKFWMKVNVIKVRSSRNDKSYRCIISDSPINHTLKILPDMYMIYKFVIKSVAKIIILFKKKTGDYV